MKRVLSKLINKVSNIYGGMSSNASIMFFFGQGKAPNCLIKKD